MYAKRVGSLFVMITLYINGYIIVTNDHINNYYHKQKALFYVEFHMSNMGEIEYCLGIHKFKRNQNFISWNLINLNI